MTVHIQIDRNTVIDIDVNIADEAAKQYAYNSGNPNWVSNREHNIFFIKGVQNMSNDILRARGHIFLNEIFDSLGLPRTIQGQVIGWYMDPDLLRPPFIEIGIIENPASKTLLLTFNVDGPILGWI